MKKNMVSDDKLDQISGGKAFFDVFTADLRGKAQKPVTLEMNLDEEAGINITLSTLEMRANPMDTQSTKKNRKTVKL